MKRSPRKTFVIPVAISGILLLVAFIICQMPGLVEAIDRREESSHPIAQLSKINAPGKNGVMEYESSLNLRHPQADIGVFFSPGYPWADHLQRGKTTITVTLFDTSGALGKQREYQISEENVTWFLAMHHDSTCLHFGNLTLSPEVKRIRISIQPPLPNAPDHADLRSIDYSPTTRLVLQVALLLPAILGIAGLGAFLFCKKQEAQ